jgi:hypothetical protein
MYLVVPDTKINFDINFKAPATIEGVYFAWTGSQNKFIVVEECNGTPMLYRCVVANSNGADNNGGFTVRNGCHLDLEYFGLYGTNGIVVTNGSSAWYSYCAGTEVKVFIDVLHGSSVAGEYVSANGGNYGLSAANQSNIYIYKASLLECVIALASPATPTEGNNNSYLSYTVWT